MSLGTYNNNGNIKKNDYSPTTYSQVKFFNSTSNIDASAMSFSFWKGLLKISIAPVKTGEGSNVEIDRDNSIDLYLTPAKATLLHQYGLMFKEDPTRFQNVGVSTNKGLIYFTTGESEFNIPAGKMFVVIKIVDSESGNVTSAIAYEFNSSQYYGIVNYVGGSTFEKDTNFANTFEFDMLMRVFESYIDSSSYAMAATVVENMKYDMSRINTKLTSIQDKLGIEVVKSRQYRNKSYFDDNGGNTQAKPTEVSYDDLIGGLSAMMED